jgi:hypothetical protein
VAGVSETALEAVELPVMLLAVTVTEYVVPFTKLVMVHDVVAVVHVRVCPLPSSAVAVYDVTADPPVTTGAVQLTSREELPLVRTTEVGLPGTSPGVRVTAEVSAELPAPLVANTVTE